MLPASIETVLIDFDLTIFNGHSHNLIANLYSNFFEAPQEKKSALAALRATVPMSSELIANIEVLEAEIQRLEASPDKAWADYVFGPGSNDAGFSQRALTYLRAGYRNNDDAMLLQSTADQTLRWKNILEDLVKSGRKVVIVSFSSFAPVLELFLKEVIKVDPAWLDHIQVLAWLPHNADVDNKNHHVLQSLLLKQHAGGEVLLVDDSQRHIDGATRDLKYQGLIATLKGNHLDELAALAKKPRVESAVDDAISVAELSRQYSAIDRSYRATVEQLFTLTSQTQSTSELKQKAALYQQAIQALVMQESLLMQREKLAVQLLSHHALSEEPCGLARRFLADCLQLQEYKKNLVCICTALQRQYQLVFSTMTEFYFRTAFERCDCGKLALNLIERSYANFETLIADAQKFVGMVFPEAPAWTKYISEQLRLRAPKDEQTAAASSDRVLSS